MVGVKKVVMRKENSNSITDTVQVIAEDANKDINPSEIQARVIRFKATNSIKIKAAGLSIESLADAADADMMVIGNETFRPIFLEKSDVVSKGETTLNGIMDEIGEWAEKQHDKIQKQYNEDISGSINNLYLKGYVMISNTEW